MNKCLIYNISLNVDRIAELINYVSEFEILNFILRDILKSYTGNCEVHSDVGFYNFMEPEYLVKSIKPVIHIMVYGTKTKYIEKKLDKYLKKNFYPSLYSKYRLESSPFDSDNEELLYNICYKSSRFVVNQEKVVQVA